MLRFVGKRYQTAAGSAERSVQRRTCSQLPSSTHSRAHDFMNTYTAWLKKKKTHLDLTKQTADYTE